MDSNQDALGNLVLQSNGPNAFAQSGQIDWVAFLRATAEASISILSRLSGSGVEPLTVLVAEQLSSTLVLSNEGQQNIHDALSQLRAFGAFGNAVWFGLGVQHLTRRLAQTREGLGCVALCASLAETYSAHFSALILSNFLGLKSVPRQLSPSIGQWKKLVETCSGCLARSTFGEALRNFMSFYQTTEGYEPKEAPDPHSVAKALEALGKVSTGQLDSLVLTGGPGCAWLGAVSEWLLGLSVVVESADELTTIYQGRYARQNERPQVKIVHVSDGSRTANTSLTVKSVYKINNISDIIRQQLQPGSDLLCVRIPWDSALRAAFGNRSLRDLTEELDAVFATALGSIAQLFTSIVMADPNVESDLLRKNTNYLEGTYGKGFVQTVLKCFPELPRQLAMQAMEFVSGTFNDAYMTYETAAFKISSSCSCEYHSRGKSAILNGGRTTNGEGHRICLAALFDTIIFVSRITAGLLVQDGLEPSLNGLSSIYQRMVDRLKLPLKTRVLDTSFESSLSTAVTLYAGYHPESLRTAGTEAISAIVSRGFCFYLDSLCELSDFCESLSRIHVIPGGIELEDRSFPEIRDAGFEGPQYSVKQTQITSCVPEIAPLPFDDFQVEAIAMEADSHVLFNYKISSPRGEVQIPPAVLAASAASARGFVPCARRECMELEKLPGLRVVEGEGLTDPTQASAYTIRYVGRTGPAWCVSLMLALSMQHRLPKAVLLRTEECLSCCVRAMIKHGDAEIISRA